MTEAVLDADVQKRAADILQQAHDYIEVIGFDIMSYDGDIAIDQGRAKPFNLETATGPQMCYIGTIRAFAGVEPSPQYDEEINAEDASAGDGPELRLALETLDRLAREDLEDTWVESAEEYGNYTIGRYVEALGFQIRSKIRDENGGVNPEREREYALMLLRKALTDIYG